MARRVPSLDRLRGGFSLVELVVLMGVLLILVSMVQPPIGKAIATSREARDGAQLHQNAVLVSAYVGAYRDVYPYMEGNPFALADRWFVPLQTSGLIDSMREVDPAAFGRYGIITFWQSACMNYSYERMLPGRTVPAADAVSSPVRVSSVVYPSSKGHLFKQSSGPGTVNEGERAYCCGPRWRFPVAMADGAVRFGDYFEFNGGEQPVLVDLIGMPVFSTWGGVHGRDK